jgi:hypothetical protein
MPILFNPLKDIVPSTEINNAVYLRTESDLPNQTATTWTMEPNTPYILAGDLVTTKECIPADGASFCGDDLNSFTYDFSGGTGSMIKGTDVSFYTCSIGFNAGINNIAFDFVDTVGAQQSFRAVDCRVDSCSVLGKFTDMALSQFINGNCQNAMNGFQFFGTSNTIWSFDKVALFSTNTSFIGVDFGTAAAVIPEFENFFMVAPAGAVGFSGLIDNGNVPLGRLGLIRGCEFIGGMADLQNISTDDLRWNFEGNSPTPNTQMDSLISFRGNALETEIDIINTPVIVNAIWDEIESSQISTNAAGECTILADRSRKSTIDIALSLISVGGGAKTVTTYLALNGVAILESGWPEEISGSVGETLNINWLRTVNKGEVYSIMVENNSNTTDILCVNGNLRIL